MNSRNIELEIGELVLDARAVSRDKVGAALLDELKVILAQRGLMHKIARERSADRIDMGALSARKPPHQAAIGAAVARKIGAALSGENRLDVASRSGTHRRDR